MPHLHIILIGQDDNGGGTDEAAVFLQGAEIQRDVILAAGRMPPDCATRQISAECMSICQTAAEFIDQFRAR